MHMDNAPYIVESSVMGAPIERRITDFHDGRWGGLVVSPNSTSDYPSYELRSQTSSYGSSSKSVGVDTRRAQDFSNNSVRVLDANDGWILNELIAVQVKSLTGKVIAGIQEQLDTIYAIDAAAVIDSEQSRVAIRAVVDVVEDYIKAKDFWSLNQFLALTEPSSMRRITSVSVLRTSFRVRDKVSSWATLYDLVQAHLKETGQDADRALRGLSRSKVVKIA